MSETKKAYKMGDKVSFTVKTRAGVKSGTGEVVALPPPNAQRGAGRYHVKTVEGAIVKPYPSQLK